MYFFRYRPISTLPFLLVLLPGVLAATQSLYEQSIWKSQRICARNCFWWANADWLASKLSCSQPADESCYCRADLQPAAKSVLNSCISTECGVPSSVDQASATSIYVAYCAGQLATVASNVEAKTTTATTTSTAGVVGGQITQTVLISASLSSVATGQSTNPATVTVTKVLVGSTAAISSGFGSALRPQMYWIFSSAAVVTVCTTTSFCL